MSINNLSHKHYYFDIVIAGVTLTEVPIVLFLLTVVKKLSTLDSFHRQTVTTKLFEFHMLVTDM